MLTMLALRPRVKPTRPGNNVLTWGARLARRLATEPAVSPGGTTSAPGAGGSGSGAETKSPNSSSSSDDSSAASAAACDGSGAGSTWPAAARTTWAALAASVSELQRRYSSG